MMPTAQVPSTPLLPISPRPVAVIDIGATSIRMAIAEIHEDGEFRTLDTLVQPVDFGREVFAVRRLSRASIERAATILKQYQRVLREYGITSNENVRVVATSAVREAFNRLAFTDRIYIVTGLTIEAIDEAEVSRITYMGIAPQLRNDPELADGRSIVAEVGGGNTEVLVIRSGNVLHSQSYRLGSLRLLQSVNQAKVLPSRQRGFLENHIRRTLDNIVDDVKPDPTNRIVAFGGDIRFAAHRILEDWDGVSLAPLDTERLAEFTNEVLKLDVDAIVKRFGASFIEAETLGPALLAYTMLAQSFSQSSVFVCDTNLRDGLLHDIAVGGSWTAEFRNQIVRSALGLGRRFDFDESHARNVADLSRKLFDQLGREHRLDYRQEVLLHVAALLHEIGLMINVRSNHKHALYVIRNSEIFGLSKSELLQVGLVARYHRRANPQPSHEGYASLDREERVTVAKLAAILRLAIALDDTRSGRIREIECTREAKQLVIKVPGVDDVSLEHVALRQNAGLFRDVFGIPVLLRAGR
ncbi:Exopolyphosphatase [Planctomycetes bacterium CA13]|uniref:Exopolyphosphatase n=1 Tax=Novipirellula herctigrandis TaxID=2527986 RepID=A0A5C5Z7B9_9BACT|nr:Exopolyphosphatase [Planctomycetes bacterium CA13]